ncbi:hypothetical protein S245_029419, partial [Arachis hypogaea]
MAKAVAQFRGHDTSKIKSVSASPSNLLEWSIMNFLLLELYLTFNIMNFLLQWHYLNAMQDISHCMQDEEALLLASLVVEDTPDRDFKHRKRFVLNSKTPPTNSRRKRRAQKDTPRKDRKRLKKRRPLDELSCAICLEICFDPSTTPCGH